MPEQARLAPGWSSPRTRSSHVAGQTSKDLSDFVGTQGRLRGLACGAAVRTTGARFDVSRRTFSCLPVEAIWPTVQSLAQVFRKRCWKRAMVEPSPTRRRTQESISCTRLTPNDGIRPA